MVNYLSLQMNDRLSGGISKNTLIDVIVYILIIFVS